MDFEEKPLTSPEKEDNPYLNMVSEPEEKKVESTPPAPIQVEVKLLQDPDDDMSFNEEELFSQNYNPFDLTEELPKISTKGLTSDLTDLIKNPMGNKVVSGLFNLVVSQKQGGSNTPIMDDSPDKDNDDNPFNLL